MIAVLREVRALRDQALEQAERADEFADQLSGLRDQLRDLQNRDSDAMDVARRATDLNERTDRTIAEIK